MYKGLHFSFGFFMSPFLSVRSIAKSYAGRSLFRELSFQIFSQERVALIGPNGAGKSTLFKIIMAQEFPDEGELMVKKDLRLAYVPQKTVYQKETIQEHLETFVPDLNDYERDAKISIALGKVGIYDPQSSIHKLSGGWKKRVDIAAAILAEPELLLLDEPTNHLDIEGILWLEDFLKRSNFSVFLSSHDRNFLENVCSKVIEINPLFPGSSFSLKGSYSKFLEKRQEFLQGQATYEKSLHAKVSKEIEWLKQSPKARSTKSRSRIEKAQKLIDELATLRSNQQKKRAQIDFSASHRQTKKLLSLYKAKKSFHEKPLFSNLTLNISPGMRIALLGKNGSGKTSLMKVMMGLESLDSGSRKEADDLQILYFDQERETLDESLSLKEALSPNADTVLFRGKSIHVNSWAKRFLFGPERMQMLLSTFSGGEKARVLIARLLLKPADILFLDEPSNDLDIDTLEVLEESLQDFPGAIVLISHDRYLLNCLANLYIGLGMDGEEMFFADYYQWEEKFKEKPQKPVKKVQARAKEKSLSYKEKQELKNIEGCISQKEQKLCKLQERIQGTEAKEQWQLCQDLQKLQAEIDKLYNRWQELEQKAKN